MKAIIATDGSEVALEAAKAAEELLHDDLELVLVTIIPEPEDPMASAGGFEGPVLTQDEADDWAADSAKAGREALARTKRVVHEPVTTSIVKDDDPGAALVDLATDQNAAVLVIGASDKNLLHRVMEGSVMRHLVKHAPCPVLVVPHD
jgi:nucleotide-binding universal stress UspA family protein